MFNNFYLLLKIVNWEHKGKTMPRPIKTKNNNSQIISILKAISNIRRLRILDELADGHEKSVSELERVVPDLSQSTLSQHQGRLRRANIFKTRKESQSIFYSVQSAEALKILTFLTKLYAIDVTIGKTKH